MKNKKNKKIVAIFCGSQLGKNPIYKKETIKLSKLLADNDFSIVYGGGKIGLMGEIYNGINKYIGTITGIIPKFLNLPSIRQKNTTNLIVVESLYKRKALMIEKSDLFLILPGGFGTLDELFEILTLNQLNIVNKPVIIFNIYNYWKNLKQLLKNMEKEGFLNRKDKKYLIWINDSKELIKTLKNIN